MAFYFLKVSPISRCAASASVTVARRTNPPQADACDGPPFRATGGKVVDYNTLIGFDGSRYALWNQAHRAERRPSSTVAREYIVALFVELSPRQNIDVARAFATWLHQRHGIATDLTVHDLDSDLPYASILTTTRAVTDNQLGAKAALEWAETKRDQAGLESKYHDQYEIREMWAHCANQCFAELDLTVRIDHRMLTWFSLTPQQASLQSKVADSQWGDLIYQRNFLTKEIARLKAKERRTSRASSIQDLATSV